MLSYFKLIKEILLLLLNDVHSKDVELTELICYNWIASLCWIDIADLLSTSTITRFWVFTRCEFILKNAIAITIGQITEMYVR